MTGAESEGRIEGRQSSAPAHLGLRVLALAAIFALANALVARQFGAGLINLSVVNVATGLFGSLFAYLQKREREEHEALGRRTLLRALDGTVLLSLALAVAVGGSLFSSVLVVADGVGSKVDVHLTPVGRDRDESSRETLAGAAEAVRYQRWTSPLGRRLTLEVAGYFPESIDLYPWVPTTVRVARDLRPVPAILIRAPVEKQALWSSGKLLVGPCRGRLTEFPTGDKQAAVLVGRRAAIPPEVRADWQLEITAAALDAQRSARALLAWKHPLDGTGAASLVPGSVGCASFLSAAEKVAAHLEFDVSIEPFQDFLLAPKD